MSHTSQLSTLRASAAAAARSHPGDKPDRAAEQLLVLAVSELATNGLKYGTPPLVISLYRTDRSWLVDARDENSDQPPVLLPRVRERLGGHGLRIISHASTAWGWYRDAAKPHKHVWAHIPASSATTV